MNTILQRIGLTPESIGRLVVQSVPKGSCGRRGLPDCVVNTMWADYQRLHSLEKVGKIHNRTRQSVYDLLSRRGFQLNAKKFQPVVIYNGRKYTPSKGGYLRDTTFRRGRKQGEAQLHRVMWVDVHGPIPAGHQVSFKDGNKTHCTLDNLFCLPVREVTLFHYRRNFGERANLTPEQRHEWWKAFYRRYASNRAQKFIARGLRSDGKPRRRGVKREQWQFRYFPPVVVRQDRETKTLRRHVATFSAEGLSVDQAYQQFRAAMDAEKPESIYS